MFWHLVGAQLYERIFLLSFHQVKNSFKEKKIVILRGVHDLYHEFSMLTHKARAYLIYHSFNIIKNISS
jgi:hypothetical protein